MITLGLVGRIYHADEVICDGTLCTSTLVTLILVEERSGIESNSF